MLTLTSFGVELQRLAVPLDRIVVALGVEVQIRRARRAASALVGFALGDRLAAPLTCASSRTAARVGCGIRRPARRRARPCGGAARARRRACCVPMIQPAIRPKHDARRCRRRWRQFMISLRLQASGPYQYALRAARPPASPGTRATTVREADKQRARHDRVADRDLVEVRQRRGTARDCRDRDRGRR